MTIFTIRGTACPEGDCIATTLATGSATHNLTFNYDRYGNMACTLNAQTNGPCPQWGFNAATNQITNPYFTYDAAGNLTGDGTRKRSRQ